jgi:hypothetical protein
MLITNKFYAPGKAQRKLRRYPDIGVLLIAVTLVIW